MKLNLHIIKEDLSEYKFEGEILSDARTLNLCYGEVCSALPDELEEDILYIVSSNMLPYNVPASAEGKSLICTGKPKDSWLSCGCSVIYTQEPVSTSHLGNAVSRLFYRYDLWEEQMQEVLDEHAPLEELGKISQKMFKNPIYAQGAAFQVIFHCAPQQEKGKESENLVRYKKEYIEASGSVLGPEDINLLISDTEYIQAADETEPTIYSGTLYGFRTLFYNVLVENIFVARICIDEIVTEITCRDYALIKVLGRYLGKGLSMKEVYSFGRTAELEEILDHLLRHILIPEDKFTAVMDNYHWEMNDTYVCLIMKIKSRQDTSTALEPIALSLSKTLLNDCYSIMDNAIVFVCNLTRINKTRGELFYTLVPVLRDNLLTASVSASYNDFKDLYYYYKQAQIIEEIGTLKHPTKWFFRFEEYATEYIVYKCTAGTKPQTVIPEGLADLMAYDKKKGSSLAQLLRIYLDSDRSIAETTRKAYIHRNTFHYRLERMQKILDMNLDNAADRLLLQIAFRVMDEKGIEY